MHRKEQACVFEVCIERFTQPPRLHHTVCIFYAHGQYGVHARQVHADAAKRCADMTFERAASTERNDGYAQLVAAPEHRANLVLVRGPHHRVRCEPRGNALAACVLVPNGLRCAHAVAQQGFQGRDDLLDRRIRGRGMG